MGGDFKGEREREGGGIFKWVWLIERGGGKKCVEEEGRRKRKEKKRI